MFTELVCPICEKVFIRQSGSIYKVRIDGKHISNLCGWNCYNKAQKMREENLKREKNSSKQGTTV